MGDREKAFCERLAEAFPDLREILTEHLADYDELLPHVFMADVTRYVLGHPAERAAIVQRLEDAFAVASEGVEELIAVSFVEKVETLDALNCALNGVTGNAIRGEWVRQHMG